MISKVHPRLFKVVRNEGRTAESTYLYLKVPKIDCVIVHVQCMIVFYSSEWHLPSKLKIMVMLKNPQQKNKIVIVIIFRLNIIVIIYLFFLFWLTSVIWTNCREVLQRKFDLLSFIRTNWGFVRYSYRNMRVLSSLFLSKPS